MGFCFVLLGFLLLFVFVLFCFLSKIIFFWKLAYIVYMTNHRCGAKVSMVLVMGQGIKWGFQSMNAGGSSHIPHHHSLLLGKDGMENGQNS